MESPRRAVHRAPDSRPSAPAADGSPWWRTAVFYELYVRSFADSDGDGVGDLDGIRERLGYLSLLGADAIWLTPFYPSPMVDHGYDVADPRGVEPVFGDLAAFDALVAEAHALGIKVTVDLVPNHTSDRHPWFQEALADPAGPARRRYIFRDGRGADGSEPPNNWDSLFGGPAWTRVPDGQWYLHLFAAEQPDLDWTDPDVLTDLEKTLRFWMDRGVDGFRIDVAHGMAKPEGLPDMAAPEEGAALLQDVEDDPRLDHDGVHEIHRAIRRLLDAYPDRMAVGEVWVDDAERLARYVRPDELHLAFNFALMQAGWDAAAWREAVDTSLRTMHSVGAPATWVLSNHDWVRHASRYASTTPGATAPGATDTADTAGTGGTAGTAGTATAADSAIGAETAAGVGGGEEVGSRRARAAALVQLALPGVVYLYYGDELGLPNVDLPDEVLQDPVWERSGHTEHGRDGERVPMPWSGEKPPYGFTTGPVTWLPMPEGWADLTVEAQLEDPASMLSLYREALELRRRHAAFGGEGLEWFSAPAGCLAFRRPGGLLCALNASPVPVPMPPGSVLLASGPLPDDGTLPPDTSVWLV
jgi:alpha-glucosidase